MSTTTVTKQYGNLAKELSRKSAKILSAFSKNKNDPEMKSRHREFAKKKDITELELVISNTKSELRRDFENFRTELTRELGIFRAEVSKELGNVKSDILKWVIVLWLSTVLAIIGLYFKN